MMSKDKKNIIVDSSEKYNNRNPISKYLIYNFYKNIEEILSVRNNSHSFLEIGCGPAESTKRLLRFLPKSKLKSSEYNMKLVAAINNSNFPIEIEYESVYKLHRDDNSFDFVLLLEVLEHLDHFEKALEEIFRVAKRYVVISVPSEPIWRVLNIFRGKYVKSFGNTPGHVNHWSKRKIVNLVSKYGDIDQVLSPLPWTIIRAKPRNN